MSLKLYNTLTRKIEDFHPLHDNEVRIYSCGPTVYNRPHIGNWRTFIANDLLRRYLKFKGYKVTHVMNLTDVDDKTIKGALSQGKELRKFTEPFIKDFFNEKDILNIEQVEYYPRATDHIKEITKMIKKLKKNNHTYESNGSTYFRISSSPGYGKLAHINQKALKKNASKRLDKDEYDKENANDFVLWKATKESEGNIYWESPFGKGRPGWHIECSAMSTKYLGETIDIHTGGVDLIFPHHTNEIAQSEGATGKKFVNYWFHINYLIIDGEKMSKSKGNFYFLEDIIKKGYNAREIRFLLLSTHYRQLLNFTFDGLDAAKATLKRIDDFIFNLQNKKTKTKENKNIEKFIETARQSFEKALDNDLNISEALSAIFTFINDTYKEEIGKKDAERTIAFLKEIDKVLAVMKFDEESKIPNEISVLIEKRKEAKKEKNYTEADRIRELIKNKGYELIDTKEKTIAKKVT